MLIREFPNRIAPDGGVRRAAYEQGRQILRSQSYRVQRILESGDELAKELECSGILAVLVLTCLPVAKCKPSVTAKLLRSEITIAIHHLARSPLRPFRHDSRVLKNNRLRAHAKITSQIWSDRTVPRR